MKIIVDVERGEKILELKNNLGQMTQQVLAANTAMKAGTITQAQFNATIAPLSKSIQSTAVEIKSLEAASMNMGRGLGQLSYAIDDVQYGFNAIVNNIPQIVMGLGGSFGLAGAIGIVAVAVNQLIKHWSDLTNALQAAWSGSTVEQLENIAAKAEAASKAWDKLASHTKAQGKEAAGIGAMIEAGPKGEILQDLTAAISKNPALKAEPTWEEKRILELSDAKQFRDPVEGKKRQAAAELKVGKALQERDAQKARELMGAASEPGDAGDVARATLGMLMPGRKNEIEALTPEGQKRQAAFEKKIQVDKEVQDKIKKANDEHMAQMKEQGAADKRATENAKKVEAEQRRHRIETMEDEVRALQERKVEMRKEMQTPKQQAEFGSTQGYLSSLAQQEFSKVPQEQLKKLEDIDKGIKAVEDAIRTERRAGAKFG